MKRQILASSVLAATLFAASLAQAQTPRTIYLYSASLGAPAPGAAQAKIASWGNGESKIARTVDYEGATVLQMTTRNFNEGVRFDLATPIDVEPYRAQGFIRLRLRFGEAGAGAEAMPGMLPGVMGEGMPGARNPRGGRGFDRGAPLIRPNWNGNAQMGALPPLGGMGEFPGMPGEGGEAMPVGPPPQTTPITQLQITLVMENGVMSGRIPINLEKNLGDDQGWRLFVLPIKQLHATPGASGPVKRLILTADEKDTFFMAQAALVIETGEMTATIRPATMPAGTQIGEITVKPGPLSLVADVEAGAADPSIEWNFDADNIGNLPPAAISGGVPAATEAMPEMPAMAPTAPTRPTGPIRRSAVPDEVLNPEGATAQVGPRIDARGLTATFSYPNEEQNYRVEVTVRDRSNQKKPVTTSILVKVRG